VTAGLGEGSGLVAVARPDTREPAGYGRNGDPLRTAFVSTYLPHRCGIATFTSDLAAAVGRPEIVALHPAGEPGPYPAEVRRRIRRDAREDYALVAGALDRSNVDVVSIQHEYGIWGGRDGEYVLDFVRALRTPTVATLHTVLREPTPSQRRILVELVGETAATVVMSQTAASLLVGAYGVDPNRLEIVPHGVPDLPYCSPDVRKPMLNVQGRSVILSFGLLGPGKGYESAIAAMPQVVRSVPNACYVILGATHPELIQREGEAYRRSLEKAVADLGVGEYVRFVDRFVSNVDLGAWLQAADIFVTPYPNLDQIVSGTLSYAMGAGKAIVSTPYAYAREQLADGRGRLVAPGSPAALAGALVELMLDPALRASLGRRAYGYSRSMVWPEVGARYRRIFARAAGSALALPASARRYAAAGG
jgi:glycosyltransferase involved in cell wall biosynthesis